LATGEQKDGTEDSQHIPNKKTEYELGIELKIELERGKKTRNERPCAGTTPTHSTITGYFCTRSSEMIQQAEQKKFNAGQ